MYTCGWAVQAHTCSCMVYTYSYGTILCIFISSLLGWPLLCMAAFTYLLKCRPPVVSIFSPSRSSPIAAAHPILRVMLCESISRCPCILTRTLRFKCECFKPANELFFRMYSLKVCWSVVGPPRAKRHTSRLRIHCSIAIPWKDVHMTMLCCEISCKSPALCCCRLYLVQWSRSHTIQ